MSLRMFFWLVLTVLLLQCRSHDEKTMSPEEIQKAEEALITANRMLLKKDKTTIETYLKANNLSLSETPSGLWYGITNVGAGKPVALNSTITIDYKVSLIDGTPCYSSDSLGLKSFMVGKGGVESGLEEGVLLLKEGSSAIFIMPPHLAHGLTGDGDKIPARSIIVYHVELLKVEP